MQRHVSNFLGAYRPRYFILYAIGGLGLAISWWTHGCADLYARRYNHPMLLCWKGKIAEVHDGILQGIALPQLPKRYIPISAAVSQTAFCVLARYTPPPTNEPYEPGSFSFGNDKVPPEKDCLLIIKGTGRPTVTFFNKFNGRNIVLGERYVYIAQRSYDNGSSTRSDTLRGHLGLVTAVNMSTLARVTIPGSKGVRGTPGAGSVAILLDNGAVVVYRNTVPIRVLKLPLSTNIGARPWDYDGATSALVSLSGSGSFETLRLYKEQSVKELPVPQAIPAQATMSIRLEPVVDNVWCQVISDIAYTQIAVVSPNGSNLGSLPRVVHDYYFGRDASFQPLSPVEVRFLQRLQRDQPTVTRQL